MIQTQTFDTPTARDLFGLGHRVRCRVDDRRGVVVGYTLHPGGLLVEVGGKVTITVMGLWDHY
jgi:hypothetical protein